jgi:hypothetical protein
MVGALPHTGARSSVTFGCGRSKTPEHCHPAAKTQKSLANDTVVKDELAALKMYELAMKSEEVGATAVSKRAQTMLKKLVKEKPDTEAGKKALAILGMP